MNELWKELEMRLFDIDTPAITVEDTLVYDYGSIHYIKNGRFRVTELKPELQLHCIPLAKKLVAEAFKLKRLRDKDVDEAKQTLVDLIEELKAL